MIEWILAIICVEAVTEIIVESSIFIWFRNLLTKIWPFLGELISCGYCASVWVAATIGWCLPGEVSGIIIVDAIIKIFVLHRVSNILHEGFSRWFDRYPIVLTINNPQRDNLQREDGDFIDGEEEE